MGKYGYANFTIVFTGATINQEIGIDAERIEYVSGDVAITVRLDSPSSDPVALEEGEGIEGSFSKFYVSTSGAGSATLLVSKPLSFKKVSAKAKIDEILKVEKTTLATFAAVSVDATVGGILIAAANAERRTLTVSPVGGQIFIGKSGVTAADGMPIAAGGSITLDRFTGAVYGITAGGAVDTRYIIEGV